MNMETERWLAPMVGALTASKVGSEAFLRLMESAVATSHGRGVDWIQLGQRLRDELDWSDYPVNPPVN